MKVVERDIGREKIPKKRVHTQREKHGSVIKSCWGVISQKYLPPLLPVYTKREEVSHVITLIPSLLTLLVCF